MIIFQLSKVHCMRKCAVFAHKKILMNISLEFRMPNFHCESSCDILLWDVSCKQCGELSSLTKRAICIWKCVMFSWEMMNEMLTADIQTTASIERWNSILSTLTHFHSFSFTKHTDRRMVSLISNKTTYHLQMDDFVAFKKFSVLTLNIFIPKSCTTCRQGSEVLKTLFCRHW